MKKQLIAAAVATAIAAPMAASADVTVYGQLHYSIDSVDTGDQVGNAFRNTAISGSGTDGTIAGGFDGSAVNSHNSRFGIKGSEDLGNGLSAVFQMEFSISGDDLGGVNNNRNTYVALAGSWGVAGIGQVDTPLKSSTGSLELFSETAGDYDQIGFNDIRLPNAVFYMSPNWNGFSVVAGIGMPSRDNDADGVEAASIAATYSNGPWFASLAYEDVSGEYADAILHPAVTDGMDYDKWRLGLGYTANGFHVGFIYEDREIDDLDTLAGATGITDDDSDSWQLSGSYTAGNNTFKIAYGQADGWGMSGTNNPYRLDDADLWSIGVDHKLSNRTKVYAVYADFGNDDLAGEDTEWDAFSVGIVHKF